MKKLWTFGGIVVAAALVAIGYGVNRYLKLSEEAYQFGLNATGLAELPERQKRFAQSPDIGDCLWLVDRVGFLQKDYQNAIEYGKRCLELPRPQEKLDWLIHFWLADLYNRTNDIGHAKEHLAIAIKLDKKKMITENGWIETQGLGAVYVHKP